MGIFRSTKDRQCPSPLHTNNSELSLTRQCRLNKVICLDRLQVSVRQTDYNGRPTVFRINVNQLRIVNDEEPGDKEPSQTYHQASPPIQQRKMVPVEIP